MRNRFHSICPYFAMFPESFVETWVDRLTKRGDVVLDPFCGRGTAPFQSLLMGRRAVGTDLNPVAFCITRAKTAVPARGSVVRRLAELEAGYPPRGYAKQLEGLPPFFAHCYARKTLRQLLYLRDGLAWRTSRVDCMIAALVLGALHGEVTGPYLSNQMPRTISTKPDYSVRWWEARELEPPERDAFEVIRASIAFRYASEAPDRHAQVYMTDMRELPRLEEELPKPIRCVITSPPYLDVTNFEEDQWLRRWFLGGPSKPTYRQVVREGRHESAVGYWSMIADFWRMLSQILGRKADVVIRIGARDKEASALKEALLGASLVAGRKVELVDYQVSKIKNRQTDAFRPGTTGCRLEVDCHFVMS